ncbi:MAG: glycosyltransferase family 9 protein, partial [Calditrichia bacterium]|nr:glycosyltransferase family 9 protein [Calditrichia bacterium]
TIGYYLERIRIIFKVRKCKYDVIVDQLRGPGSAQITMFSGAKYRLGWMQKRWNWVYNYKVKRDNFRYYASSKFDLLKPLGVKEELHNTYYKVKDESIVYIKNWLEEQKLTKEKIVVFSPGTPVLKKQWSLDYFVQLGDIIKKNTDFEIILLWGPGEKEDVEYIKSKMETEAIVTLPTTFNEAGALLKNAEMFIGNDGGINHLAVAMETPSIAIFGPTTNPKKWIAWHKNIHFYLRDWDFRDKKDNTFNISPEQVFSKFKEFFKIQ